MPQPLTLSKIRRWSSQELTTWMGSVDQPPEPSFHRGKAAAWLSIETLLLLALEVEKGILRLNGLPFLFADLISLNQPFLADNPACGFIELT